MADSHPDSSAVDRVGTEAIMAHFDITRQAVSHWRRHGIAKSCRLPLALLGEAMGLDMKDLRSRYGSTARNSPDRASPTSGAVPA